MLHFYVLVMLQFYVFVMLQFYVFVMLQFYVFVMLQFYVFVMLHFFVFVMLQFYIYRLRPVRRRHVSCHRPYVPAVQSGQAVPHSIRCKDLSRKVVPY